MKSELLFSKSALQWIETNCNFKKQYLKNTAERAIYTNELFLQFNWLIFQHVDEHVIATLNELVMPFDIFLDNFASILLLIRLLVNCDIYHRLPDAIERGHSRLCSFLSHQIHNISLLSGKYCFDNDGSGLHGRTVVWDCSYEFITHLR